MSILGSNIFFDSLICGFLAADGFWIGSIIYKVRKKKIKTCLRVWVILSILTFSWLTIFYGSFIEPRIIVVREKRIVLNNVEASPKDGRVNPTESIRAAVISDLHIGVYKKDKFVERVVSKIMEQKPDVVFIVGDFVSRDAPETKYLEPIKNLKAPLGIFAVLGNHDYGDKKIFYEEEEARAKAIRKNLENLGITVLVNQAKIITKDGKNITLAGVDDLWTKRANISEAIASLGNLLQNSNLAPFILLAHNPDIVKQAASGPYNIDLVVAGHTHGGQIRLPFWGPVVRIPNELGNHYDEGIFEFGKTKLAITSGIGELGPRARLWNPPEILILDIAF